MSTERHLPSDEGMRADTPTKSRSSVEGEEEGSITPAPLSSLCIAPSLSSDIVSRQVGATASERRLKRTRTRTRSSKDSPRHLHLKLVNSDQKEREEHSACIMALSHLFGVSQVPPPWPRQRGCPRRVSEEWSPHPSRAVLDPAY
jgi:hypothetical protein